MDLLMQAAGAVWAVPPEILSTPPSVRDGTLTREEEALQRVFGCGWIQRAAILLRIPVESAANAQVIFHRFYFRRSMKEFDIKVTAAACVYLGCKIGESPRRVRDIVRSAYFLDWLEHKDAEIRRIHATVAGDAAVKATRQKIDQLESEFHLPSIDSHTFRIFQVNIQRVERHILRETGFMISCILVHPHRYILQYIHSLFGETPTSLRERVSQRAWGHLNDSLRTTLCCSVRPAVITVAAIYLSACDCGIRLPKETHWCEVFDVRWEEVEVCTVIKNLYTQGPLAYRHLADPPVPPPPSPSARTNATAHASRNTEGSDPTVEDDPLN